METEASVDSCILNDTYLKLFLGCVVAGKVLFGNNLELEMFATFNECSKCYQVKIVIVSVVSVCEWLRMRMYV